MAKKYSPEFYAERRAMTYESARRILSILFAHDPPASVVDVGCGTGTWLATALELGAEKVQGVEGTWNELTSADIPVERIERVDLEQPLGFDERFDLAISLEVAEHLSEARAPGFVADLCALSDRVLFSAAIPAQGGTHHVNERWQSYWANLFAERGYQAFDVVRPQIWTESEFPFWYRQNIVVYVNRERADAFASAIGHAPTADAATLDVVHPDVYARVAFPTVPRATKKLLQSLGLWR